MLLFCPGEVCQLPQVVSQKDVNNSGLTHMCGRHFQEAVERHWQQLIAFHDELQVFVEALFVFCCHRTDEETIKEKIDVNKIRLLNQDQIANPSQVITAFYNKFPIAYILRELNDWLEAGISYPGTYPETMSELQALHTFRSVLCLVQCADRLIQDKSVAQRGRIRRL